MAGGLVMCLLSALCVFGAVKLLGNKPSGGRVAGGIACIFGALFFAAWAFNLFTPDLYF